MTWQDQLVPQIPWRELDVMVCGIGVSGTVAAEVLLREGAHVTVVDESDRERDRARADALRALGATVRLGPLAADAEPDLVVTSPGWRPDNPLLVAYGAGGVPVWGEVELAWRFTTRPANPPDLWSTLWLGVTGTNGKTTTTEMLAAIIKAMGLRGTAAGNIGAPLLQAVLADPVPEVLAVELSSFQLHWASTIQPHAAAILNIAEDHLDWHGSMSAYTAAKRKIWHHGTTAVFNRDDPRVLALATGADAPYDSQDFGLDAAGCLGVEDGWLVERCWGAGRLMPVDELQVTGPHNVANALAAAGVAVAGLISQHGDRVAPAIRAALAGYRSGAHRNEVVAVVDGVTYVDDSKATNPHAAAASLSAYESVVWIAGGLNKGLSFDELARDHGHRLRAAMLIGRCAGEVRDALARHAPDVPVHDAASMHTAVETARSVAQAGDTVLLAPAAASMDMFRDYAERGDMFAASVRALEET